MQRRQRVSKGSRSRVSNYDKYRREVERIFRREGLYVRVAQGTEQLPSKQSAGGSIPSPDAK